MRIVDIDKLNENINLNIDYFFCCASFEERCFSIAKNLTGVKIVNAVFCHNVDQISTFKGNDDRLLEFLLGAEYTHTLNFDSNKPTVIAEEFLRILNNIKSIERDHFLVDITTFTHEALLILFRLLDAKKIPKENITFLYNNASDYSINETVNSEKWLSVGIKDIRSIIGYSGFMSPLKKTLLTVLVGFEPERTRKLIDNYEPNVILLGVGNDYSTDVESAIEINKQKHRELIHQYPNAYTFEFSVLEPNKVKEALKTEIEKFPEYNIVIAPMNNKISTIGAALLALENTELQLCYVAARFYNTEGYSLPGSKCFIINL